MRRRAVRGVVLGLVVGLLGVVEVPGVVAQERPAEPARDVLLDGAKGLGGTAPGLKGGGRDFGGELTTPESKSGVKRPGVVSEVDRAGDGAASGLAPVDVSKQGSGPKSKRVEEVVSLRTEGSESFRLEDGSMVTDILSVPKWFKDSKGEWAKVDPKVVADPAREGWLTNAGASWDVSFGPSSAGLEYVVDGIRLGSRLVGVADVVPVTDERDPQVVWYRGVWPGVDVSYRVSESAVKETFVVKDRESLRAAGDFKSVWSSPGRLVPSVEMV